MVLMVLTVSTAVACSGDDGAGTGASDAAADDDGAAETVTLTGEIELSLASPDRCEHFDAGGCLLPFPSDHYTTPDDTTPSGRRLALAAESMPVNADGVAVDPTEWNRDDGFSSGSPILVVLPGLDPQASGLAPVTDIGASLADDAPIVLLDADSGERVPYWAELDAAGTGLAVPERTEAPTVADEDTTLVIRPARNMVHGHRHVVALRDLVDGEGEPIGPSDGFRAYRDRLGTDVEAVEARRSDMEQVFTDLESAGLERDGLVLAWDFTVRSTPDVTGRLLAMRDDAFADLGDAAPAFTVDAVDTDDAPAGARVVTGRFTVPNYLTGDGGPGAVLANEGSPDGIPERNGDREGRFVCVVPTEPGGSG